MELYRQIDTKVWTDAKVSNDFEADDTYAFIYLLTSPLSNLIMCYELPIRTMAYQMKLSVARVEKILNRLANEHKVIGYDTKTQEVCIINAVKRNVNRSPKILAAIVSQIETIKSDSFRKYYEDMLIYRIDTVSIPYGYPISSNITNTITIPNPLLFLTNKDKATNKEETTKEENDISMDQTMTILAKYKKPKPSEERELTMEELEIELARYEKKGEKQ